MSYQKPNKTQRNAEYLKSIGFVSQQAYQEESILPLKMFLIICEGLNTEPLYFDSFPVPSKSVITMGGKNTKSKLVEFALNERDKAEYADREVWCVFDFDIKPDEGHSQPKDFNDSIKKAKAAGLHVAWSNDAFELWFLLHYKDLEAAHSREEIYPILKDKWNLKSFSKEAKKVEFCKGLYDLHNNINGASQPDAIRRAKRLHEQQDKNENYAKQCPCTTVYLLVEELNKYCK